MRPAGRPVASAFSGLPAPVRIGSCTGAAGVLTLEGQPSIPPAGSIVVSKSPAVALTIAGSDSGGGAGIQADLKTFEALGVWGTSALTAVTAQNTLGVHDSLVLPAALGSGPDRRGRRRLRGRRGQDRDAGLGAVIEAVASAVADHGLAPVVVDPVLVTSHGDLLLEADAIGVLRRILLPLATLVTPNIPEAEALLSRPIGGVEAMVDAAAELASLGPEAVLLKGGHLGGDRSPDLLWRDGANSGWTGHACPADTPMGPGAPCRLPSAPIWPPAELWWRRARGQRYLSRRRSPPGVDVGHGVGPVNPGWRAGPYPRLDERGA